MNIPLINPHKFGDLDVPDDPRYHTADFDKDWFVHSFQKNQNKIQYTRKMGRLDPVTVIFDCTAGNSSMDILDCYGNVVVTGVSYYLTTVAGNYAPDGTTQLYTYAFTLNLFEEVNAYGKYYLLINKDASGNYPPAISEPIDLQYSWTDTLGLKYWDDKLNFDVPFNIGVTPAFYFFLRIDGYVSNYQPLSTDVTYEDETYQQQQLYSQPYRSFDLCVGGYAGVPDYDVDRVNRAMACSNFYIGEISGVKKYEKANGAKWSLSRNDSFPYGYATVTMREGLQTANSEYNRYPPALLYKVPFLKPYVIDSLVMKDANTAITVTLGSLLYMDSPATQATFIDGLNGGLLSTTGLQGHFGISAAGYLQYVNGPGEAFAPFMQLVYSVPLILQLAQSVTTGFSYTYISSAQHVVAWNKGGVITLERKAASGSGTASHTFSNTVPATSDSVMIFHKANAISSININGSTTKNVTGITGQVPVGFTAWSLTNFVWLRADLNFLRNATASISGITMVSGSMHSLDLQVFSQPGWNNNLLDFYVGSNTLTTGVVDNIFNTIALPTVYDAGGNIDTRSQTPGAPPTSASAAARTLLAGAGKNITTD